MNALDLDTLHLARGAHNSPDDGMCVMEAVSFYASENFSYTPTCVSPVIRAFLVAWNDALDDDDRQTLKRYVPLVVGTNAGPEVDERLSWMALDWLVRVHTPAWLRLAGLTDQADTLSGMAEVTVGTCPSILPALQVIRSDATVAGAAWDAADAAAWAAAWAAARAAGAAAGAAARAAAGVAARAAAGAAARAAGDALRPTVEALQESAHDLVSRMIAVAKAEASS